MDYSIIIAIIIIVLGIIISIYEKLEEWDMEDVFSNMRQEIKGVKRKKVNF